MNLESTKNFYDKRGNAAQNRQQGQFGSSTIPWYYRAPYKKVESILANIPEPQNKQLLDFCCGTGIHSVFPAKLGFHVVGVDLSPQSIQAAKFTAKNNQVDHKCEFFASEASEYLKSCEQFDVILISGSLYYLNESKIWAALSERLKPGGHFVCVETNGSNYLFNWLRRLKNYFRNHRDETTLNNLLKKQDLIRLGTYFGTSRTRFYNLMSLAGVYLRKIPQSEIWYGKPADFLDTLFLNMPFLNSFAFKFVFHGIKGKKQ